MIYDHECNGAEVRRNFGVLSLSFVASKPSAVPFCKISPCGFLGTSLSDTATVHIKFSENQNHKTHPQVHVWEMQAWEIPAWEMQTWKRCRHGRCMPGRDARL